MPRLTLHPRHPEPAARPLGPAAPDLSWGASERGPVLYLEGERGEALAVAFDGAEPLARFERRLRPVVGGGARG